MVFQASSAVEEPIDWGDDHWTLHADAGRAKDKLQCIVADLVEKFPDYTLRWCFTHPSTNWRKDVLPTYKHNRKGTRKPVCYVALKDWVKETWDSDESHHLEADDLMGILSTKYKNQVIVSEDKDMKTIPGRLYHPRTDEMTDITEDEADYWHMFQALTGDATDGYRGCPGVGPKKAEKLLQEEKTWDMILEVFHKAGLDQEEMTRQVLVSRILRHGDWDKVRREVTWTPSLSDTPASAEQHATQ